MKTTLKLENPKHLPELLLFFGMVLVLIGSGLDAITSNPTLANDGWIVVIASILLWVFGKMLNPKGH